MQRKRRSTNFIQELSQAELKAHFSYNPETGVFIRLATGEQPGWHHKGYRIICVCGGRCRAHRLAWLYMTGEMPKGQIDHINGDPSDNRWANLRVVDYRGNARNLKLRSDNKSGICGVKWSKKNNNWEAYIGSPPENYLGCSKDFFEACCMRKSAENRLGYHPNHGQLR